MALRLAINGLGRIGAQFVRVVEQGGFNDLFEIVAIHDASGPDGILRLLRHDSVYGRFPGELVLEGESLRIGDRSIAVSSTVDAKNAPWSKDDIPLVIVDGSAQADSVALDQHVKKGAKRVILPAASTLASFNLGIGINEASYDPDAHIIVASAGGAPGGIGILYPILDALSTIRSGTVTTLTPASERRGIVDTASGRGGVDAFWPLDDQDRSTIYAQLLDRLGNRLRVMTFETPARSVGALSFGVWLEQRVSREQIIEAIRSAAEREELAGLLGTVPNVEASIDLIRDARTVVVDEGSVAVLYETFLTLTAWFDAEWGAACRLADSLALICEEGVPGTA